MGTQGRSSYIVPELGEARVVRPSVFLIGRHSDSHLVVRLPDVSRRHAEIQCQSDRASVVDLESRAGTFLNGQRVSAHEPRTLGTGDELRLGETFRATYLFVTPAVLKRYTLEREQQLTSEHATSEALEMDLTPREQQVTNQAIKGLSNAEIARELKISVSTVKLHLQNTYAKTGAQGRTELAALLLGGERPPWLE